MDKYKREQLNNLFDWMLTRDDSGIKGPNEDDVSGFMSEALSDKGIEYWMDYISAPTAENAIAFCKLIIREQYDHATVTNQLYEVPDASN